MSAAEQLDLLSVVAQAQAPWLGQYRAGQPETAKAAALAVKPRSGSQRARVLLALAAAGDAGLTDYELAQRAGIRRMHTAGTRRLELNGPRDGGTYPVLVEAVEGTTRPTDTDTQAQVWRLTDAGHRVAAAVEAGE